MAVFFPELFEVFVKLDYERSRETRDWTEYIHTRETQRPRNAWLLPEIIVAWPLILWDAFCSLVHLSPKLEATSSAVFVHSVVDGSLTSQTNSFLLFVLNF